MPKLPSPEAIRAMRYQRLPDGTLVVNGRRYGPRPAAVAVAAPSPAPALDDLLDWRGVAAAVYGPSAARTKTYSAIKHLWSLGVSDGRGGVIRLACVATPSGRRSTPAQCGAFLASLAAARLGFKATQATDGNHQLVGGGGS